MSIHDAPILDEADHWRSRDLGVLWHPCTQMREHPDVLPLVPIERGDGPWLVGRDGRIAGTYGSNVLPDARPLSADIEAALGQA